MAVSITSPVSNTLSRQPPDGSPNSAQALADRATGYQQLGDFPKALNCLRDGIDRFPGEPWLRQRFDAVGDQFLVSEWQTALDIGKLGRSGEAQLRMQKACEFVSSIAPAAERLPHRPIRSIAIVGNLDMPQCYLYRVEQKVEQLRAVGYPVAVYDYNSQVPSFFSRACEYDAVIFYRVPATMRVIAAILKAAETGAVTFYEIDDLIFTRDDYPGTFESFLGQITYDTFVELKLALPMYRHAMSLCDYGIASTAALASEMEKIVSSGQVFVHRNAFGRKHERAAMTPAAGRSDDRVTIFYGSGTRSHKEDFRDLVEPALVEMVTRYGSSVHIILAGYTVQSEALLSLGRNVTFLDAIWDIEEYWAVLRQADINLAVLKRTPMTDCKSEIKWMEAAMFGIPSVVSGTLTHQEVIEPGVTGLLCSTAEEWTAALDLLVRDATLRRRIGLAACRRVQEGYNIARMGENLISIFAQTASTDRFRAAVT
jgi:glycosyltransferase involved in cell wall biosynthesis